MHPTGDMVPFDFTGTRKEEGKRARERASEGERARKRDKAHERESARERERAKARPHLICRTVREPQQLQLSVSSQDGWPQGGTTH